MVDSEQVDQGRGRWWAGGILVLVLVGLVLRFTNLDRKYYWHDESSTSYRAAGYLNREIWSQLNSHRDLTVSMLQEFHRPNPDTSLPAFVRSWSQESPDAMPFFMLLSFLWMRLVGSSPAAMRALAAVIAVLVLPAIYWLCLELFRSRRTAWIALGLAAVSPFFVLYAQEARPYSLLALIIVLSSAALLRALRTGAIWSWVLYAVVIAAMLYTQYLFAVVMIAHGLYVLIGGRAVADPERSRLGTLLSYLAASVAGLLLWILYSAPRFAKMIGWVGSTTDNLARLAPPADLLRRWVKVWSGAFIDLDPLPKAMEAVVVLPVLVLVVYSLVWLLTKTRKEVWLFPFLLIGIPLAALMLPDLLMGTQRAQVRYLTPSLIGLLLAVAHLLAIQTAVPTPRQRRVWQVITAAVLALALLSSIVMVQSNDWWNKHSDADFQRVVQAVNAAGRPLLVLPNTHPERPSTVSDRRLCDALSLSHNLGPHVRLRLVDAGVTDLDGDYSDIFWLYHTDGLEPQSTGEDRYRIDVVIPDFLWHLTREPGSGQ